MKSVQDFSFLWSDESENSSNLNISNFDVFQGSLLLYVLKDVKYIQNLNSSNYSFDFYEIEIEDESSLIDLKFPSEVERGKFEYKVRLIDLKPDRMLTLGTQMKWRIQEGNGEAFYELGVSDNGRLKGLNMLEINESIDNIIDICKIINANIICARVLRVSRDKEINKRFICEIKIMFITKLPQSLNRRIFLFGSESVGKTTLVGVFTKGVADDGNGFSRMGCFTHPHEVKSGETSCISLRTIGFDQNYNLMNYSNHSGDKDIFIKSNSSITFVDSCGRKRYIDTTLCGLTSFDPHSIFILINPKQIDEYNILMLKISLSWLCPLVFIFTHCDHYKDDTIEKAYDIINQAIENYSIRKPKLITSIEDVDDCKFLRHHEEIPIVPYSNISLKNYDIVQRLMLKISLIDFEKNFNDQSITRFSIYSIFELPGPGLVVSGILISGLLKENDNVYFGPINEKFQKLTVISIKRFDHCCKNLQKNEIGTVALGSSITIKNKSLKGTYLLSTIPLKLRSDFEAMINDTYTHVFKFLGLSSSIIISNFNASGMIETVAEYDRSNEKFQNIRVNISVNNKTYYIPTGSRLMVKLKEDFLVGYVLDGN